MMISSIVFFQARIMQILQELKDHNTTQINARVKTPQKHTA